MYGFTLIFLAALTSNVAVQLWLAGRQVRHIRKHRGAVPPAFAGQISLPAHQKAADYSIAKTRLGTAHALLEAAVLLAFTLGGGLQALSDGWQRLPGSPLWQGSALILSTFFILSITEIPLALYRTFVIDSRFGFNKTTPLLFAVDLAKQAGLALLLGIPLVLTILWLMAAMGKYWWLYAWLAWMVFNLLVLALYPTVIAPLFNRFSPLGDPALQRRIEQLLQKCGFRVQGVLVMDGSRRTSHGNAYFTGLGRTKRIVFFDTLLARLAPAEIEAVLAHELGHFKRHHVHKRIAWLFVLSLAGLWLLGLLMPQPWFYHGLGVSSPSTAMALVLFLLISPVFAFLLHPLASLYSRRHEFEADHYAAQQASADHLIRALVKLYSDNAATTTPDPWYSAFYDSHPPAGLRIAHLQNAVHN